MPLYDLILQVKSHVPRHDVFNLLKRTSLKILDADGVLVDVKSFGHQTLAYVYKKPNERHHEVQMSQLTFASAPKVLPEISHALRVDEKVVRWMVLKRKRKMEPLIKYKAWTEEQRAAIESRENNNDNNNNNAGSEGGGGNRGREFGGGGRGGRR
jgi:small subunit ribosomal protein S6